MSVRARASRGISYDRSIHSPRPNRAALALLNLALCTPLAVFALNSSDLPKPPEHHAEHVIRTDTALTLVAVLDRVLQRHPMTGVVKAMEDRAAAEEGYASGWFPDGASLSGYHMSDRTFDDLGAYENQVAISLPLWRPGEKRTQTGFGENLAAESDSARRELRWKASGTVRESLWGLESARRQWQLALEQQQRLEELLADIRLQAEVGEMARADELAALQELGAWQTQTLELEAAFQDAARWYHAISGLEAMPARLDETLSEREDVPDDHPALSRARDRVAKAEAAVEVALQAGSARPSLDVYWRDNRGDAEAMEVDSLGIGLTWPLGRSPRRAADVALAEELAAEARAHLAETCRDLELQLHEARHMLHTMGEQLSITTSMLEAGRERNRMDRTEHELGEISMSEWLRRLSAFKAVEQQHELLLIRQKAAIAAYNQAVGDSL